MRTIAVAELMLSTRVRATIFIFGEIIAGSCNTWPVSKFFFFLVKKRSFFISTPEDRCIVETKYPPHTSHIPRASISDSSEMNGVATHIV